MPPKTKIRGDCGPKFFRVKEVFEELFEEDRELGAGVVVNLDPRSEKLNSETAIIYESRPLSERLAELFYGNDLVFSKRELRGFAPIGLRPVGPTPRRECWNDGLRLVKPPARREHWNNGFWGIEGMVYWENQVDEA